MVNADIRNISSSFIDNRGYNVRGRKYVKVEIKGNKMNKKPKIITDLGDKVLFRANCFSCSVDYFEVIKKGKKRKLYLFCDEHK